MNEAQYQQTIERISAVNEVIRDLDPAIRAEAFSILKPYVTGTTDLDADPEDQRDDEDGASSRGRGESHRSARRVQRALNLDEMVEKYSSEKDYENARLALAVYFHRHGKGPFDLKHVRALGVNELNLDLPDRIDMSLKRTKHDGKLVLRKQADGTYKVTPSGERYLKETYGATKGRAAPPAPSPDD